MLDLGLKEKFVECPYCSYKVGSDNPICRRCGLEMTSDGITELAEMEELEKQLTDDGIDFSHVYNLRFLAIISLAMTILGGLFA